jgi:hypothetical protein
LLSFFDLITFGHSSNPSDRGQTAVVICSHSLT